MKNIQKNGKIDPIVMGRTGEYPSLYGRRSVSRRWILGATGATAAALGAKAAGVPVDEPVRKVWAWANAPYNTQEGVIIERVIPKEVTIIPGTFLIKPDKVNFRDGPSLDNHGYKLPDIKVLGGYHVPQVSQSRAIIGIEVKNPFSVTGENPQFRWNKKAQQPWLSFPDSVVIYNGEDFERTLHVSTDQELMEGHITFPDLEATPTTLTRQNKILVAPDGKQYDYAKDINRVRFLIQTIQTPNRR